MAPQPEPVGLRVKDLSWGPHPTAPIIRDISFDVPPGSITVIVGANGAGKSSLLRCLYRQNRPHTGQMLLGGQDITAMAPRELARKLAAVLQESSPDFSFTTREVVALGRLPHQNSLFGLGKSEQRKIEAVLSEFDLQSLADKPFVQLSGGEKQRALLARALLQEPSLLVLDEPTNHLDIRHQLELLALLKRLKMTLLLTLHDLTLAARLADQVLVMAAGRLIAAGPPETALSPAVIRQAFGVETDIDHHPRLGTPRLSFYLPEEGRPCA